jgi:hypothetical protein
MANASNSNIILAKQIEAVWGTAPTPIAMDVQRISNAGFTPNRAELEDDSLTGSRGIAAISYGNEDAAANISGNLAFGSYDDLFASACMNNWVGDVLSSDGSTAKSFTFEIQRPDISVYELWTGVQVNSMNISSPSEGYTTVTFDCLAKTQTVSGTARDAAPTAWTNTEAMQHCGGIVNYDGAPTLAITGIDVSLENGLTNEFTWGSCSARGLSEDRSRVSGTITAFMANDTFVADSLSGAIVSIDFTLIDSAGNSIKFDIPNVKLGSVSAPIESSGPTVLSIPFKGQTTTSVGGSSATFIITRTAA